MWFFSLSVCFCIERPLSGTCSIWKYSFFVSLSPQFKNCRTLMKESQVNFRSEFNMLSLIIYSSFIYESRRFEYRLSIGLDSFTGSRENKVTSTWIWNYSTLFFLLLLTLFWRASFFKKFAGGIYVFKQWFIISIIDTHI